MTNNNDSYNKELILAHQHIKKQYQKFMRSTAIKSEQERLAWAHATEVTGYIAYNCDISPRTNPREAKKEKLRPEFYNTVLE